MFRIIWEGYQDSHTYETPEAVHTAFNNAVNNFQRGLIPYYPDSVYCDTKEELQKYVEKYADEIEEIEEISE